MDSRKTLQLKTSHSFSITELSQSSPLTNATSNSYKISIHPIEMNYNGDLIDEREQRILNFLESKGIEFKSPLDKYYDYCENARKEANSMKSNSSIKSKMSCSSLKNEETEGFQKNRKNLILSSNLYKKRKFSSMQTEQV